MTLKNAIACGRITSRLKPRQFDTWPARKQPWMINMIATLQPVDYGTFTDKSPTERNRCFCRRENPWQAERPTKRFVSPLSTWLRRKYPSARREGYGCRESFFCSGNGDPIRRNAFVVTSDTAAENDLDDETHVTWTYYRKIWWRSGGQKGGKCPLRPYIYSEDHFNAQLNHSNGGMP